ncbi:MAG: hypothetical protein JWO47_1097 [Candidatus Saccharibacteria bacterium]|nr:hypothetical protein [Candidatus Saccharibacteria bacterium]
MHRSMLGPNIEAAYELAYEGMEEEGLAINGLTVNLRKVTKKDRIGYVGWCDGPQEVSLFFKGGDVLKSEDTVNLGENACTILHEGTHAKRLGLFSSPHPRESAASEGIASINENIFTYKLFGDTRYDMNSIRYAEPSFWDDLSSEFEGCVQAIRTQQDVDAFYDRWFHRSSLGYQVGMWAVIDKMNQSATIAEIIQMPAREILKL